MTSSEINAQSDPPQCRGGTYLLTWTTYGSWMRGDQRGFVGRVPHRTRGAIVHNVPGQPYDADMPDLRSASAAKQQGDVLVLEAAHAQCCLTAFLEVASNHSLRLRAAGVMRTHVHLVVESPEPEGARLLQLFKGVSSRRLGQQFAAQPTGWWTRHGSRRLLPNERAVAFAMNYVLNQPSPLLIFTDPPQPPAAPTAPENRRAP